MSNFYFGPYICVDTFSHKKSKTYSINCCLNEDCSLKEKARTMPEKFCAQCGSKLVLSEKTSETVTPFNWLELSHLNDLGERLAQVYVGEKSVLILNKKIPKIPALWKEQPFIFEWDSSLNVEEVEREFKKVFEKELQSIHQFADVPVPVKIGFIMNYN